MSTQPKGMARAALEREEQKSDREMTAPVNPVQLRLNTVALGDGRVRLVNRGTREIVGTAVNDQVAERTRRFFS